MKAWLKDLTRRERLLVSAMLGLVAVLLISLLIVRPLVKFRTNASQNLAVAQGTADYVGRAVENAAARSGKVETADNLRGIITSTAQKAGLRWLNIRQGQEDLTLTISFSGIQTDHLFGWLIELEERRNIVVRDARVSDTRNGSGVEASITFVQGR